MKITRVTVHKKEKENSRMKGIAAVTLDDCFVVKGIRILEGDNGLFIAMPSKDRKVINENGEEVIEHFDVAHPVNQETRKMFEDAIFEEYNKIDK